MQNENSGSSRDKKQKVMGGRYDNETEINADTGGNEYTAAFIVYCQKTLDSFRRVYDETYVPPTRFGSEFEPEDEDEEFELEQHDEPDSDDYKEREALKELSEQFEQMLKEKAKFDDKDFELEKDDETELDDHKEKEELEEIFEQFEQMFGAKSDFDDEEFELEQDNEAGSNGHKEEDLEGIFGQFEQMLRDEDQSEKKSSGSEKGDRHQSTNSNEKEALKDLLGQFEQMLEKESDNKEFELDQDEQYRPNDSQQDEEIDQALSGVGEVVKSSRENLGIVEAFWEEPESERAKLLTKAEITQEKFEQTVTRVGLHLYDVKDCLEGWGDLSMLPETYEQLLLANNELSEIFEKMYGKSITGASDERNELTLEEEIDDWELDDDDWELDDDDDI